MIPNESPQNEDDEEMTQVMLKDEGGVEFISLKKGGWCRRKNDMKASRCTLGIMRLLVANAKQKQCENYEETFDNKSRLAKHKKYCTKLEAMSGKEQKIRRKTKRRNKQLEGKYEEKIEFVDIKDIKEEVIKCVGKTKYLGTIISRNGKGSEDIKRRIDIASVTTNQLNKSIYRAKNIKLKTKINLHKSLVNSILLYNAECWQICKADEVRLKSFQKRCLKRSQRQTGKLPPEKLTM